MSPTHHHHPSHNLIPHSTTSKTNIISLWTCLDHSMSSLTSICSSQYYVFILSTQQFTLDCTTCNNIISFILIWEWYMIAPKMLYHQWSGWSRERQVGDSWMSFLIPWEGQGNAAPMHSLVMWEDHLLSKDTAVGSPPYNYLLIDCCVVFQGRQLKSIPPPLKCLHSATSTSLILDFDVMCDLSIL
jgi:hypothetical protein